MLRHVSVDVSSEYYKRNLTLILTLNLLLSLRLYHFYGLFTAHFLYEEAMSVRIYDRNWRKYELTGRSRHRKCSLKIVVFKISQMSRKTPVPESFLNKVTGWSTTLLKKRLWHRCFLVTFVKFSRTSFLLNISMVLFLNNLTLCEKCLCSEFFWSVFSHIRTEYGEIFRHSPYSVRLGENAD